MRHFCGSFATRQFQLCGIFQRIHGVFAIFRLFDDGIAHVQGHHDSTKGQMVNVQILYESATIKRSAMLGEESEEALHQRVELAFGQVERFAAKGSSLLT